MISNLLINFSLLTTFIFFGDILLGGIHKRRPLPAFAHTLYHGIGFGILGIILMHYSFPVGDRAILDLRVVSLLASTYLGGGISGCLSTAMIGIYRLEFVNGGITRESMIGSGVTMLTYGYSVFVFSGGGSRFRRWMNATYGTIVLVSAALLMMVGPGSLSTIIAYAFILLVSCLFTFTLLDYLMRSKEVFTMLKEAAERDFLTGLHNPRAYESLFNETAAASREKGRPFGLLILDIDHFKQVNDRYGHAAGDRVLARLAEILRDNIRAGDNCARKGGEEFAVLLQKCDLAKASKVAEKLRLIVENTPFPVPDAGMLKITVSIGIASFPDSEPDELFQKADEALYRAKAAGRNRFCTAS